MDGNTCGLFVSLLGYFPSLFGAAVTTSAVPSFSVCGTSGCNVPPVPVSMPTVREAAQMRKRPPRLTDSALRISSQASFWRF